MSVKYFTLSEYAPYSLSQQTRPLVQIWSLQRLLYFNSRIRIFAHWQSTSSSPTKRNIYRTSSLKAFRRHHGYQSTASWCWVSLGWVTPPLKSSNYTNIYPSRCRISSSLLLMALIASTSPWFCQTAILEPATPDRLLTIRRIWYPPSDPVHRIGNISRPTIATIPLLASAFLDAVLVLSTNTTMSVQRMVGSSLARETS